MQLSLRPISHPEFGEITIDDPLFLIGRDEPAFQNLPKNNLSRLSRRHARIFEQDGVVYVIDLNSRNGTQLNGHALTNQPMALKRDDTVSFANEFTYQVDNLESETAVGKAVAGDITLVLQPEGTAAIEPMVISAFPFLISKQGTAFAKYGAEHQREVDFLSRRHAHVFTHDGQLYLEDLGSTNGTFVNGHRLEETKIALRDDDVIAFGGSFFVYRVTIELPPEEQPTVVVSATEATATNRTLSGSFRVDQTTFVTAATSFLEIFCADDRAADALADSSNGQVKAPDAQGDTGNRVPKNKVAAFFAELRGALSDEGQRKSGVLLYVALALVVGAAAVGGYVWLTDPTDRITGLVDSGEYDAALSLARPYLAKHSEDSGIATLARTALVARHIPAWLEAVEDTDQQALQDSLSGMRTSSQSIPQTSAWPDVLEVIGDLEITVANRGGIDQPVALFGEEAAELERLLARWGNAIRAWRRELTQLRSTVATLESESAEQFATVYNRAFSNERGLRNLLSAYQRAADELRQVMDRALPASDFAAIENALERLKAGSTSVSGIERLERDLANYRAIDQARERGDPVRAAQLAMRTDFHAPPFALAAQRVGAQLPPPSIIAEFEAAESAWRRGSAKEAINALGGVADPQWQAVANTRLAQMQQILARFDALRADQDQEGYSEQLLDYYNNLDRERDSYFRDQLTNAANIHRKKVTKRAQSAFAGADKSWSSYQANGKITSTQRLASSVSKTYRRRANELANAYRKATSAVQLYGLARPEVPNDWLRLLRNATSEIELQRRSLRELRGVVRQDVLQKKLALLPDTKASVTANKGGSS